MDILRGAYDLGACVGSLNIGTGLTPPAVCVTGNIA